MNNNIEPRIAKHRAGIVIGSFVESFRVDRHEDSQGREKLRNLSSRQFNI